MEVTRWDETGEFMELKIDSMSVGTCLEMTFMGASTPWMLAVILSGVEKEADIGGMRAIMPSPGNARWILGTVFDDI